MLFPPEVGHNCDENGSIGYIKRVLYFLPPQNGIVLFSINRYVVENGFVDIVIDPEPDLIHANMYMRHTSTTFFAKSHHVIALTLDNDRAIVHDDLRQESVVSIFSSLYIFHPLIINSSCFPFRLSSHLANFIAILTTKKANSSSGFILMNHIFSRMTPHHILRRMQQCYNAILVIQKVTNPPKMIPQFLVSIVNNHSFF